MATTSNVDAAISFSDVKKHFGKAVALDGVSFDVPKGAVLALVGPNGAGKTTLFSIAANFLFPDAGTIHMLGKDVTHAVASLRGRFSMLPQDASFMPDVSARDQIMLYCRMAGMSKTDALVEARRALEIVGLSKAAARKTGQLSHGMSKRLAVSQAFLGSPELIMLDEPTSGLDPENASNIRNLVRDMVGGQTVLISSHNLLELQDMCTHCAILDKGRLVVCTSMETLLGGNQRVRMTLNRPADAATLQLLQNLDEIASAETTDRGELVVHLQVPAHSGGDGAVGARSATPDAASDPQRDAAVAALLNTLLAQGYVPHSMQQGARLEERFLELVGARSDGLGAT